jgi:hypothetical protein
VDDQVAGIEETIANALESWPIQDRSVLESFPGMTTLREAVLLSAMGDLLSFRDDRQLRKLLGWYPEAKESGTTVSQHHLGQSGNRMGRREVWLWVMFLISPKAPPTPFRTFYRRLRSRGMPGRTAVGHVAGKLISVLFHCLRSGHPYDAGRHANDLGGSDANIISGDQPLLGDGARCADSQLRMSLGDA